MAIGGRWPEGSVFDENRSRLAKPCNKRNPRYFAHTGLREASLVIFGP